MSDEADVVFFRIPLCRKYKQVEVNLAQVRKHRPNLKVEIYTLLDHIGFAQRHDLLAAPAFIIHGKPFRDILSIPEMQAVLSPQA